jgi:hypothetical protein
LIDGNGLDRRAGHAPRGPTTRQSRATRAARAPRHASRPRAARAAAQQLSTAWTAALRKAVGDLPLDLRVSYDGDRLHDNVAQGAELDDLPTTPRQ